MSLPWIPRLRSSLWFAVLFQGLSGLLQVKGYVGLAGADYLAYQAAFVTGAVASMLVVLNLENAILAGTVGRSATLICRSVQLAGLASCLVDVLAGAAVPNVVSFCTWFVCVRLFLAMSAHQSANFPLLTILGLSAAVTAIVASLPWLLLASFAASLAAGWEMQRNYRERSDPGIPDVLKRSALSYVRYLPHTIAGMFVGYLDRYLALYFVDSNPAEHYLRAVQLCSMSAFLIYPLIYDERNKLIRSGSVSGQVLVMQTAFKVLFALVMALVIVMAGMKALGSQVEIDLLLLTVTLLAVAWAQLYQVVSPLNFLKERFGLMNAITTGSALVASAVAGVALTISRTELSLAAVLFAAWLCLFAATSWSLIRNPAQ